MQADRRGWQIEKPDAGEQKEDGRLRSQRKTDIRQMED
jgi:hypothetical protein